MPLVQYEGEQVGLAHNQILHTHIEPDAFASMPGLTTHAHPVVEPEEGSALGSGACEEPVPGLLPQFWMAEQRLDCGLVNHRLECCPELFLINQ
jgi:hypothetical protein